MKYRDVVDFEPITEVIQLREADEYDKAQDLVSSFVISDRMADDITGLIIPNLQYEEPADNKGMMIVGNYGTGKSHLMSVITAVAEHEALDEAVTHPDVAEEMQAIAGKFKILRVEIGSTTMPLREIILQELEKGLAKLGISFEFPGAGEVSNNKDALMEMMDVFRDSFPEQGLLLAVDELLDYLRSRKEQELVLDLNFLRELGEVCRLSRFRFIGGLQESLFDSPRFQFVAESVRRVKDRFEQFRIVREDVAHVVSQRLLSKDKKQLALVREHLEQFAPLYSSMNERMDEFVRLFPVHPTYLEKFEEVLLAEKREILKTLSRTIGDRIDEEVPENEPGVFSYDSYWPYLRDNPSLRSNPDVREVVEKSEVLENRIKQAFTRPQYRPTALQIIHALSIHRLTTGDIHAKLGPTAEELRDELCIFLQIPEPDPEFLRTTIETVLNEITKTVSGQFLSFNQENGQYFLDLQKDVDFDALIEEKADTLDSDTLNQYYYEALSQLMECSVTNTYVRGYKIWEHEVEWPDRNVARPGYLFFGAPNQRSTAQPPRDFYLYFLQPFDPPRFQDEKRPDEVFFRLTDVNEDFTQDLRLYAGAREMAKSASSGTRRIYENRASNTDPNKPGHLQKVMEWMQDNLRGNFDVTYKGVEKSLAEWLKKGKHGGGKTFRDTVNAAGSVCLSTYFEELCPEYPSFPMLITRENREQAARDAISSIAGSLKTKQATGVLDALELLDGDKVRPTESSYARHVLGKLKEKGEGQVLNRSELFARPDDVDYMAPDTFRLEPEWVAVLLTALVHSGDITLALRGTKVDASNLKDLTRMSPEDIADFKYIQRPKDISLAALQKLFELFDLPKGLVVQRESREEGVRELQKEVSDVLESVVQTQKTVREGLPYWDETLLSGERREEYAQALDDLKEFLESLQAYNSSGKLRNFKYSVPDIEEHEEYLALITEIRQARELVNELSPVASYLSRAEAYLPSEDGFQARVSDAREEQIERLRNADDLADPQLRNDLQRELRSLKKNYTNRYMKLHERARLGANEDRRKGELTSDYRVQMLQRLVQIELLPQGELTQFQNELSALKTCFSLTQDDLENSTFCPHCEFRPADESVDPSASARLDALEDEVEDMMENWTTVLLENLQDPTVQQNLDLLKSDQREMVDDFISSGELPDPISDEWINTVQEVLSGLDKVVLQAEELRKALASAGTPCTPEELRQRFDRFIEARCKGKDQTKIRIVLE